MPPPPPSPPPAPKPHTSTEHNIRQHLGNSPMVRKDKGLQDVHNPLKTLFGDRIKNRKKK
jgi:hypothetical protein